MEFGFNVISSLIYSFLDEKNLPTIRATIAQEPDLFIPYGACLAISVNCFSASANPLLKASIGLNGKFLSLITN